MKSHNAIGSAIVKSLLDAGHNVTTISNVKFAEKSDNYRIIYIPDVMEEFKEHQPDPFEYMNVPILVSFLMMPLFAGNVVQNTMTSEELQNFLDSDEHFDVCIMELFEDEALLGIPEKFKCVLIFYTTFDAVFWTNTIAGNIAPSSYIPNPFLWYTDKMSFKERLFNTFIGLFEATTHYLLHLPIQRFLYQKYFPKASRTFDEMLKNSSITFINNHVSSSYIRPYLPTQIEIGGIHVNPVSSLPSDIQSFLDDANDGVIYFTMGSYIDGTDWKLEHREAFLKVFSQLTQKVLWKYNNETLPGNPGNIKIGSWFPQRDILAHPNVKIFITHGGLLGTSEATYEGVPILGIPIFGDQMLNIAKIVKQGYGLKIDFSEISEEKICESINALLNNPSYKKNAKEISKKFKDRPRTPQEEVVFWTEYAARHHGAAHLQANSVNMSFIQMYSFDIYFVIIVALLIILYIKYKIVKIVLRNFFRIVRKKQKSE